MCKLRSMIWVPGNQCPVERCLDEDGTERRVEVSTVSSETDDLNEPGIRLVTLIAVVSIASHLENRGGEETYTARLGLESDDRAPEREASRLDGVSVTAMIEE